MGMIKIEHLTSKGGANKLGYERLLETRFEREYGETFVSFGTHATHSAILPSTRECRVVSIKTTNKYQC